MKKYRVKLEVTVELESKDGVSAYETVLNQLRNAQGDAIREITHTRGSARPIDDWTNPE